MLAGAPAELSVIALKREEAAAQSALVDGPVIAQDGAAMCEFYAWFEAAQARGVVTGAHPRLQAFLARIHGRPAYQRALEKGGPYELMG